jgi:O-acetyl-ADP-ribose deacetylase (regulator of RNase III)
MIASHKLDYMSVVTYNSELKVDYSTLLIAGLHKKRRNIMSLALTGGDITKVINVNAIVSLINPQGNWYSDVNESIIVTAGDLYHTKVRDLLSSSGLHNGQVIVAQGSRHQHNYGLFPGTFDDVIFVVDTLESPLNELVKVALKTAQEYGYKTVALPLMRTGATSGIVEPDLDITLHQMYAGIKPFINGYMDIYMVIDNDPYAMSEFGRMMIMNR